MAEGVAIAGLVLAAAGAGYSAYSSYQQGQSQEKFQKSQAEAAQVAAEANAAEMERQAKLELERASIAQLQGEQEAAKRSRILASDIGSAYASYAGNGLLVDSGSPNDVLGSVLKSTVGEGMADIETIRDNAAVNVWNYEANRQSLLASAANTRIAGANQSSALIASGDMSAAAGNRSALSAGLNGLASVGTGYATAASKFGVSGKTSFWNPTGSTSAFYTGAK